jgi:hypothetical protein
MDLHQNGRRHRCRARSFLHYLAQRGRWELEIPFRLRRRRRQGAPERALFFPGAEAPRQRSGHDDVGDICRLPAFWCGTGRQLPSPPASSRSGSGAFRSRSGASPPASCCRLRVILRWSMASPPLKGSASPTCGSGATRRVDGASLRNCSDFRSGNRGSLDRGSLLVLVSVKWAVCVELQSEMPRSEMLRFYFVPLRQFFAFRPGPASFPMPAGSFTYKKLSIHG